MPAHALQNHVLRDRLLHLSHVMHRLLEAQLGPCGTECNRTAGRRAHRTMSHAVRYADLPNDVSMTEPLRVADRFPT